MSGVGHNAATPEQLKIIVKELVDLETQKKGIADEIKDNYKEAKECGFTPKALRKYVKLAMEDAEAKAKREADDAELERLINMGPLFAFTAAKQAA